jgi:RNA recognition motif-containing protein
LKIEKTKEECTIFVGNLKKLWSESHINNLFRSTVKEITEIKYLADPNLNNKNRGYCFLKFDNPQFAKMVKNLKNIY